MNMIARFIIVVLIVAVIAEVLFCRWLATKSKPTPTGITIAAGIASFVGPVCALLPYTDYLPPSGLAGVWLLAAIGAIGIGIGVVAFSVGNKSAATICVLTNIPVLAYWGFIGTFVSMGGSR
jgi:hypothetical protein